MRQVFERNGEGKIGRDCDGHACDGHACDGHACDGHACASTHVPCLTPSLSFLFKLLSCSLSSVAHILFLLIKSVLKFMK